MKYEVKELLSEDLVQYTTEDERWYRRRGPDGVDIWLKSVSWISSFWPKGKGFEMFLKRRGDEADEVRDLAAERGSKIHQAIEQLLRTNELRHDDKFLNTFNGLHEELTADEYWAVLTFVEFCKEYKPLIIWAEKVVVNEAMGYAGTLDLLCIINGEPWIIDLKTGRQVYMSHRLQVSAYAQCMPDEMIPDMKRGILQIGYAAKKGFKLTEVEDEFEMFKLALAICNRETVTEKPNQVHYPTTINMRPIWDSIKEEKVATSSKSPAENLSAKSTEKKGKSKPTPGDSSTSSVSRTTTKARKQIKSKSSSKTGKKKSASSSPKKRGTQSDSSSASARPTSEPPSPSA